MTSPFALEPYAANPIIQQPTETGGSMLPAVLLVDDLLHMWFTQTTSWSTVPTAIYHATSIDGFEWVVDPAPALEADGSGFDAFSVAEGRVIQIDGVWIMYYNAREEPGPGPGPAIGRATAPSPDGPWKAGPSAVVRTGNAAAWDSGFVSPAAAIASEDGVQLFYSGGTDYATFGPTATGLARSVDTKAFTKESRPVIDHGTGWDGHYSWEAAVFPLGNGLAAFYTGDPKELTGEAIGYASSSDGVVWAKATNNPLLEPRDQEWASLDVVAGSVVTLPDGRVLLYYSGTNGGLSFSIGVAEAVPVG
ncbi:MAG: hypothetical protein R2823_04460 [Acidimicrobiia bacterium]